MKKRIFSILLALTLATTLILSAVPALAAQTITVSVSAPADWDEVNLYIWENETPMSDWPGSSMVRVGDWWTLEIPVGYTSIVINDGMRQTIDLEMDGNSDVWIVIPETNYDSPVYAATVYTDAACTQPYVSNIENTDYLAGLDSVAIVGIGIPGVSEWNPADPAGDMTLLFTGVYVKELQFNAGDTMEFKFAGNDMWDDHYNYGASFGTYLYPNYWVELVNGGDSYDITFSTDRDCNIRFTLNLNAVGSGGSPVLWIDDITDDGSDTEEMITVHAKVPYSWSDVRLWAWIEETNESINQELWPGELVMTKDTDGWYSIQIPSKATGILINANGGSMQTIDITGFETGKDLWINAYTDYTNAVFAYEEITDIFCLHSAHDSYGYCVECNLRLGHRYDCDYTCDCGAYCYDRKTVYLKKPDNFTRVLAYWQFEEDSDWVMNPLVEMTQVEGDIYSVEVPSNAIYVFFSNTYYDLQATLSDMTYDRNIFDPDTNSWITYAQAVPPEENPPVVEPTEPEQKPTKPDRPENDDDDDDEPRSISVSTSGDPSWIFITLAAVTVVGMVVLLILNLKKK